jgi:hypothetical protein
MSNTARVREIVELEPPWIEALPRLADRPPHDSGRPWRGHGELLPCLPCAIPGGTRGDPVRNWALALRRRCSVCGCTMNGPFCSIMRWEDEWESGVFTNWIPGPMHKSCAIYSAVSCPFFRYPTSRERRPGAHALRGEAKILAFHGYGSAYFAETQRWGTYHLFAYSELVERIPFGNSRDLLPLFNEAVAADAARIDLGTRLYWGDSAADQQRLMECKEVDDAKILEELRLEHPLAAEHVDRSGSGPNG